MSACSSPAAGSRAAANLPLGAALAAHLLRPLGARTSRLARTPADMAALALPPPHPYDPGWVFHGTVIGPAAEAALCLHRLLVGDYLDPHSLCALMRVRPVGGALAGRPWTSTGYGLGLMIGEMRDPETGLSGTAVGHSAGGPGSTGAVYRISHGRRSGTAAVFTPSEDEGSAEFEALRLVLRPASSKA